MNCQSVSKFVTQTHTNTKKMALLNCVIVLVGVLRVSHRFRQATQTISQR